MRNFIIINRTIRGKDNNHYQYFYNSMKKKIDFIFYFQNCY